MGDFDPTDVEFCADHVMVTLDNNQDRIGGRVVVFKKYNPRTGTMETVLNITGTVRVSYSFHFQCNSYTIFFSKKKFFCLCFELKGI